MAQARSDAPPLQPQALLNAFSSAKLGAQGGDPAPLARETRDGPGRQTAGADRQPAKVLAKLVDGGNCGGDVVGNMDGDSIGVGFGGKLNWMRAKQMGTTLDGKPPPAERDKWDEALGASQQLQQIAKEERLIQSQLAQAGLNYNELWAARERERSSKALSNAGVLQRDIKKVAERMRKSKRGLLDPHAAPMQVLDLVTLLALGFTVIVTPYEIGLVNTPGTALVWTNYTVTAIFGLGIIVQFFLPYRETPKQGGRLIKNHSKIALHYLRGPFFIDVISTVPYDQIWHLVSRLGTTPLDDDTSATKTLKLLRMLRAVRLLKLGRIFRASRILTRMADQFERWFDFNISHAARTLTFWTAALLVLIHWYVCFWCLLAQFTGTQRTTELEAARQADGSCERGPGECLSACEQQLLAEQSGTLLEYIANGQTWLCQAIAHGKVPWEVEERHWEVYAFVLGADIAGPGFISPTSTPEYVTNFFFQFIMLIVSNIFVGVVATAQSESDPLNKAFKARMDHLNHFLDDVSAPEHIKRRTRDYLRSTKDLVAKQGFSDLFDLFSPKLRGDVLGHVSSAILSAVPYFASCEAGFMREISQKLKHTGYEAGDRIKRAEPTLCVVTRGTAVRGGTPITVHQFWGEDMIVTSPALRDNRVPSALTYLEIVCLTRTEMFESLEDWEESAHAIRIESMRISMIRAPQLIAQHMQQRARRKATGAASQRSAVRSEVNALNAGLANIGKGAKFEHREFHAVMKKINGGTPLRGFAREQRHSADPYMAKVAVDALTVAGDEGKLLIDEDGQVVGADGKTVKVMSEQDDAATKAVGALRQELRADYKGLAAQMEAIKRMVERRDGLRRGATAHSVAADENAPPAGRRRRRRHHGGSAEPVAAGTSHFTSPLMVQDGLAGLLATHSAASPPQASTASDDLSA